MGQYLDSVILFRVFRSMFTTCGSVVGRWLAVKITSRSSQFFTNAVIRKLQLRFWDMTNSRFLLWTIKLISSIVNTSTPSRSALCWSQSGVAKYDTSSSQCREPIGTIQQSESLRSERVHQIGAAAFLQHQLVFSHCRLSHRQSQTTIRPPCATSSHSPSSASSAEPTRTPATARSVIVICLF